MIWNLCQYRNAFPFDSSTVSMNTIQFLYEIFIPLCFNENKVTINMYLPTDEILHSLPII